MAVGENTPTWEEILPFAASSVPRLRPSFVTLQTSETTGVLEGAILEELLLLSIGCPASCEFVNTYRHLGGGGMNSYYGQSFSVCTGHRSAAQASSSTTTLGSTACALGWGGDSEGSAQTARLPPVRPPILSRPGATTTS